jgi:type I restriction enzyme, S subunit
MKQGWERKKLGEICEVITKGTTPTSIGFQFTDSGVNFIKVESLTETGEIISNKVAYISEECHQALRRSQLKANDILFSIAGALGRIGIVQDEIVPANTNQALAIIRLAENVNVSVNFLAKYFVSDLISKEIENLKGGAAQQNLSLGQLNNLPIPIPPLTEQQRIVAILDEAFAAIAKAKANAEQNLRNAKELFESYLQSVFENKGEEWEEKKLSVICEVKDGTHDSPKYIKEGIPFVTQKNIRLDGLSFADTRFITETDHEKFYKRSNVTYGDILISMIGANRGMAALVDDKRIFSIKNVGLIKESKNINKHFLLYYLKSSLAMKFVLYMSNGGAQEFIGLTALRSFPIPLPSLSEQQTIVQKLDALSAETKKLETIYQQKINDLEELKKSILQKAFNGELKTTKEVVV